MHGVVVVWMQAEVLFFWMDVAGHECRQGHGLGHLTAVLAQAVLQAWNRSLQLAGGQVDPSASPSHAPRGGLRLSGEQGDRVDPSIVGVASEVGVALPDGDRYDARGKMGVDDDARVNLPVVRLHGDHLALSGADGGGRLGRHFDPGSPGRLEHRVRNFLKPRPIRTSAIEEVQRRIGDKRV